MESKDFDMVLCLESGIGVQHRTLRGEGKRWHGLNFCVQAESAQVGNTEYEDQHDREGHCL